MANFLTEVRILREEGKLHQRLITRVRMLASISLILAVIVVFNIVYRGAPALIPAALFLGGLLLGIFVFSRMNVIQWDEEKEVIQAGRMDVLGYGALALYIVFEIGLRTFLHDVYPVSATVFVLAAVAGTLLGRTLGTIIEIHRVYRATHGA